MTWQSVLPVRLTLEDVLRTHYVGAWRRWWPYLVLGVVIPLRLFSLGDFTMEYGDIEIPSSWLQKAVILLAALFMTVTPYFDGLLLWRKQKLFRDPMQFSFSDEGVELEGSGFSSEISWNLIHRVRETRTLFLIQPNPQTGWILPKRFLEPAEQEELREYFKKRLPNPGKQWKPPGWVGKLL